MGGNSSKYNEKDFKHFDDFIRSESPQPGDLLEFSRGVYNHWAVYEGFVPHDGETAHCVIHFSGEPKDKQNAKIQRHRLKEVAGTSLFRINNDCDDKTTPLPREKIIERARSKISQTGYHVGTDNCEHFAKWCRSDKYLSTQKGLSFWDFLFNGPVHPMVSGNAWLKERERHPDERENWFNNLSEIEQEIVLERMAEGYPTF
uniref:LRAT domain-containing protein n=1 Tax=Acrobeloides nanus TaxID=290746 RepID=A0A914D071_9BILA